MIKSGRISNIEAVNVEVFNFLIVKLISFSDFLLHPIIKMKE